MIGKRGAIPGDAQKMIKAAASRAGMSVSEWLNEVILDAAADEGVKNLRHVFQNHTGKRKYENYDFASIYSRLDDIAAKIEMLSQGNSPSEFFDEPVASKTNVDSRQQKAIFDRLSDLLHMPAPDEWSPANGQRRKSAMR